MKGICAYRLLCTVRTYRPFLHSMRGLKSNDIILKEGAEIITDKSRIANIFNDYFVNIANHIEAPSEEAYGRDFADHPSVMAISGSVSSSFFHLRTLPALSNYY